MPAVLCFKTDVIINEPCRVMLRHHNQGYLTGNMLFVLTVTDVSLELFTVI